MAKPVQRRGLAGLTWEGTVSAAVVGLETARCWSVPSCREYHAIFMAAVVQEGSKPIRTWEVLKGVIGKDLLDADLPISQYAPFTALHARCAELECTRLLDQVSPTSMRACCPSRALYYMPS